MTYGVITNIPQPIESYDATTAEIVKAEGTLDPAGLILHVARPTGDGFEIFEVWESKAHADKYNEEVVGPALGRIGADMSGPPPETVEFDADRVIVPHRH